MEGRKKEGKNKGQMEGWKDGRMEGWKEGKTEGWLINEQMIDCMIA